MNTVKATRNPSQYQCDNISKDDQIVIIQRNPFYKWYRKYFMKDKIILNIKMNYSDREYKQAYQEDCYIITGAEIASIQNKYLDSICLKFYKTLPKLKIPVKLEYLEIGLKNTVLQFSDGNSYILDTFELKSYFDNLELRYNQYNTKKELENKLKFTNITGSYLIDKVKTKNIKEWLSTYCEVCGNPVIFRFYDNKVVIDNKCDCGNIDINETELSYNDMALWYHCLTNKVLKKKFEDFWRK